MHISEINIRDPFILNHEGKYYLYGTPGKFTWTDHASFLLGYCGTDLEHWDGPFTIFEPEAGFWADRNFWAPEVYAYRGKFYMFCSFKSADHCRGTQILVCDTPLGQFKPLTDRPITPWDWECLDGTLYVEEGHPWIVFCHEWLDCGDGEIWAMPLLEDLTAPAGAPVLLFRASEAKWTLPNQKERFIHGRRMRCYVTDGPYLRRLPGGALCMIWSSFGKDGYALGQAISENGVTGPWKQLDEPLFGKDGGHGMIFDTFDGQSNLILHQPNETPLERPVFFPVQAGPDGFTRK